MGLDMFLERMPRGEKPRYEIATEIGYWRKANQIHNWFVNRVQDGIDDCRYHHPVSRRILEELIETCQEVLGSCEIVEGKVNIGMQFVDGEIVQMFEDGKCIKDSSIAESLLPSRSGFFFGGTDYDEWYIRDLEHTIEICKNAIETTDFKDEVIYYISSW